MTRIIPAPWRSRYSGDADMGGRHE
jgi:hypothetical protein